MMKKILLVLALSLGLLIAVSACSSPQDAFQNDDIEAATKVINEFYQLRIQGDIEASNMHLTENFRKKAEEELARLGSVGEYVLVIIQNSEYEIKSVKQKGDEIFFQIDILLPNTMIIMQEADKSTKPGLSKEENGRIWIENAINIAKSGNIPKVINKTTMILVKENGQWKIDRELPN